MSATTGSMTFNDQPARLPKWANTLLVIALGWALAVLMIKFFFPVSVSSNNTVAVSEPANIVRKADTNPVTLAQVTARQHLFGDATKAPVEAPSEPVTAPVTDTSLQLELSGVFAYDPAEKAIAIINQRGKEQGAYGIGDKIVGEVTLEEVHKDYVILNNRGKRERLKLPENVQPIATRPLPVASSNAQGQGSNGVNEGNAGAGGPVDLPTTPGALRDTLARNPSMLGRIVAAEPYQENGKLLGYRITPKQNPEILEAQGILPGDVITRVNNIQLNSQKQGIRALRNAVKAQALEVTILRDGAEIPLSISLAQ